MQFPVNQLLIKEISNFNAGSTLLVDPLYEDDFYPDDWPNTHIWSFRSQKFNANVPHYTWPQKPDSQFDNIVVYFPKSKDKLALLLNALYELTHEDTIIYIIGENKGGIKSCAKLTNGQLKHVNKQANGKHCIMFSALFEANFQPKPLTYEEVTIKINDNAHTIASLPGVFCHGRLDEGTQLLLENIPNDVSGHIYDFACGSGVIGSYLGKHFPYKQLVLSDVDSFALQSSQKTLELNNIQATCELSDGLTKISSKFDWIFTNPPFHTGVKIDYDIAVAFFRDCRANLKPNGKLVVVANSFLKYPPLLQTHFKHVNVLAETTKFKLYICS